MIVHYFNLKKIRKKKKKRNSRQMTPLTTQSRGGWPVSTRIPRATNQTIPPAFPQLSGSFDLWTIGVIGAFVVYRQKERERETENNRRACNGSYTPPPMTPDAGSGESVVAAPGFLWEKRPTNLRDFFFPSHFVLCSDVALRLILFICCHWKKKSSLCLNCVHCQLWNCRFDLY